MNAGILRGVGDNRTTLRFLLISSCVNIILDFLFIAGFHMDVAGVALATIIAMFSVLTKYLNGIGAVKYPTIINLLMLWAVRIPVSYAIDYFYDGTYFMYSMPINYIFGLLCVLAYFPCCKQWIEICKKEKAYGTV